MEAESYELVLVKKKVKRLKTSSSSVRKWTRFWPWPWNWMIDRGRGLTEAWISISRPPWLRDFNISGFLVKYFKITRRWFTQWLNNSKRGVCLRINPVDKRDDVNNDDTETPIKSRHSPIMLILHRYNTFPWEQSMTNVNAFKSHVPTEHDNQYHIRILTKIPTTRISCLQFCAGERAGNVDHSVT